MRLRIGVCGGANPRSYAAIEDESDVHGPCSDRAKLVHRVQGLDVDLDLTMAFAEAARDTGTAMISGPRVHTAGPVAVVTADRTLRRVLKRDVRRTHHNGVPNLRTSQEGTWAFAYARNGAAFLFWHKASRLGGWR